MNAKPLLRTVDPRRSLTARMFLVAILLVTATLAAVTFVTARTVRDRLSDQIGENFQAQADGLSELMGASILEKVGQLQTLALSDSLRSTVTERNASYTDGPEEILSQIQSLDERWLAAADNDPLIVNTTTRDPTVNPAGDQLAHFLADFGDHTELFVTDRYGATVAATGRLSDYYQADEDWWKRGWDDGAGAVYISDPEFDESAGVTALLVAVPVSSHNGEPIGVLRSTLNVDATFSFIADVTLGETGHAVIFGEAGEVLFAPRAGSGEGSAHLPANLRRVFVGEQEGFEIAPDGHGHQSIFGHFAVHVDPAATGGRASAEQIATAVANLGWTIVVRQEASEALATVDVIVRSSVIAGLIAAGLAGLLALLATRAIITRPLVALQTVAEKIGRGDLRTTVPIRGPDEIASLGGALEHMRAELQELYAGLEQRVEERTQELSKTNEQLQGEITERERAEEALRAGEAHTRAILDTAVDAIITIDGRGTIESFNQAAERMFGFTVHEAVGKNIKALMPQPYRDEHDAYLANYARTGETKAIGCGREVRGRRKDGTTFPMELSVAEVSAGDRQTFTGIVRDITERKQMEDALREQARRDPLTGALNHAAIVEELQNVISVDGDGGSHAVAMIDVDGLKATNDTYGHQTGDAVLVAVTQALSRDGALVGRYGGDEFVAVLPNAGRTVAQQYRDEVLHTLASAALIDSETGTSVAVAASIGLATYPEEADSIADLINLADSAMYASRRQRPVGPTAAELSGANARLKREISKRERAEKVLGESEERYRELFEGANDIIYTHDLTGRFTSINKTAERVTGYGRNEVLNEPIATVVAPEYLELAKEMIVRKLQGEPTSVYELEIITKDGRRVPLELSTRLIYEDGKPVAVQGIARDITERRRSEEALRQAREESVVLLAAAAEAHDHTTGIHLQGVRAITEALASELGYSDGRARELALAAVLHDIGKIRVPESVLASTGQLAGEEWELMKHHTTWGAQFLANRPSLDLAATIARSHHERCDGGGYPDGLSGEAIPEAATIVSVADSFDAMTHDRPYRARRSIDQAVREIAACSGTQFNPRVVDALERLYQRNALPLIRAAASDQEAAA